MLIPQALDGVEIEVLLETENGVKMVAGTLSSPTMSWEAGKIYTYAISSSSINWEYVFDVTQTLEIAQGVTSKKYEVTSYRYRIGDPDVKEAVAWTAKWNEGTETDLENKIPTPVTVADVIADFTYEGNGSNTGDAVFYDMELTRTKMHTTYGGDVKLQIAQEKGTPENPYDLSTEGGAMSQTTANCYVVNAPGTYKLPLVFGNAIEKGSPNSAAYNNSAFVDYKGKPINNPYIKNVSGAPRDATLVWSDGFYMFEDVHLEGDYLVFSLNKDFMQQANGVVAVRDESGAIMWSWHIWVTERNVLTEGIHQLQDWKDGTMNAYGLMQCNLGWVDGKMVYYNQRDFSFTFTQAGTGTEKVMTVEQSGATFDYKDVGSTYYQWGRKDPLVALRNWNAVGRDDYRLHETGSPEYVYTVDQNDKASVNMAIQHPNVFYTSMNFPNAVLWNNQDGGGTESSKDSQKTVYDPSPRGFKVPVPRAFAVLVNGGTEGGGSSEPVKGGLNGYKLNETPYNKYRVYTEKGKKGEVIPLTATGQRAERDVSLPTYDEYGSQKAELGGLWAMYGVYYWSCVQKSETSANTLVIREDIPSGYAVYSYLFSGTKTMARPVRCIKDE